MRRIVALPALAVELRSMAAGDAGSVGGSGRTTIPSGAIIEFVDSDPDTEFVLIRWQGRKWFINAADWYHAAPADSAAGAAQ